jgi:hemolysin III
VYKHREDTEEFVNALTHGIGALLALLGGFFLLSHTFSLGPGHFIGSILFSASLVTTFVASMFYHMTTDPMAKQRYRILDHSSIYVAIAGGYSPILLVSLADQWGLLYCIVVWLMALGGVYYKSKHTGHNEEHSLATYLMMGWIGLLIAHDIIIEIPGDGLLWFLVGGILYTSGVYFYYNDDRKWYHTIWHLFVLGGSLCHYIAVYFYVMQPV